MKVLERLRGRGETAAPGILRLSGPDHPARQPLDAATEIVDRHVELDAVGGITSFTSSSEVSEAIPYLEQAAALAPDDLDVLVAKASVLHAAAQFKSAEEVVDAVLDKDPGHFEARTWKEHWATWATALQFPRWGEAERSLHPVMKGHLAAGHRLQVVRDGLQKALAILIPTQGSPPDTRTRIEVDWVLSPTPFGPLVAYYTRLLEPSGEPSVSEAFLPIFEPSLFSPMEGYFLVQQLAFSPYYFWVSLDGEGVVLNRRIVLAQAAAGGVRELAAKLASGSHYLPQERFQDAMQWHMSNFDMDRMRFT
jgi:hypothetical protein